MQRRKRKDFFFLYFSAFCSFDHHNNCKLCVNHQVEIMFYVSWWTRGIINCVMIIVNKSLSFENKSTWGMTKVNNCENITLLYLKFLLLFFFLLIWIASVFLSTIFGEYKTCVCVNSSWDRSHHVNLSLVNSNTEQQSISTRTLSRSWIN
jgi:hypothetical protein